MLRNKLMSNLLTGTAILASFATSGYAGFKVLADKNEPSQVPEVKTETTVQSKEIEKTSVVSNIDTPRPSASPSVMPEASVQPTPIASVSPAAQVFDDAEDERDELERVEKKELRQHEDNEEKERDDD